MKSIFIAFAFLISAASFSQNITNTPGTNGVFTIKDGAANYLSQTITYSII